jgi:hypothetical protein
MATVRGGAVGGGRGAGIRTGDCSWRSSPRTQSQFVSGAWTGAIEDVEVLRQQSNVTIMKSYHYKIEAWDSLCRG